MKHIIDGKEYETIPSTYCSAYDIKCHFAREKDCSGRLPTCNSPSDSFIYLLPEQFIKTVTNRLLGVPINQGVE